MESGSPEIARRAIERISKLFPDAGFHLCTCHSDTSSAFFSTVFRVADYPGTWKKLGLLFSFWRKGWEILVILCTGEPILWRWKILALFMLRSKVIIVNENADFFWLDWANRRTLRRFLAGRWGINRTESLQTFLRLLVFPLTLLFLLATVGFLYLRRACRLLLWKMQGVPGQGPQGTERH
jgi:hypothetical protein